MSGWRNTLYWSALWILGTVIIVFLAMVIASIPGCTMHFHVMGKYYSKEKKPEYVVTMPAEENTDDEIVE